MSIYIRSKNPGSVRPNTLRVHSLSPNELKQMIDELEEKGTAFFRFGGYPHHEFQIPETGEKIVMVHRDIYSVLLYRMRVLASGDECAKYVDNPASLICVDDCSLVILTNIMGPIRIKSTECRFLDKIDLGKYHSAEYLQYDVFSGL